MAGGRGRSAVAGGGRRRGQVGAEAEAEVLTGERVAVVDVETAILKKGHLPNESIPFAEICIFANHLYRHGGADREVRGGKELGGAQIAGGREFVGG